MVSLARNTTHGPHYPCQSDFYWKSPKSKFYIWPTNHVHIIIYLWVENWYWKPSPKLKESTEHEFEASVWNWRLARILSPPTPSLARANINMARSVYAFTSLLHDSKKERDKTQDWSRSVKDNRWNINPILSSASHIMLMILKVMNAESSRKCAKTKINRVHFAGGSKHGDLGF